MALDALMGDARAAVLPTSEQTAGLGRRGARPPAVPPTVLGDARPRPVGKSRLLSGGGNRTSPPAAERRTTTVPKPA
jgi:hypothetical protein